jgi:hypothetical protein
MASRQRVGNHEPIYGFINRSIESARRGKTDERLNGDEATMNYRNITVAGSGILRSQIAFQAAYKGFRVSVFDIWDEVLRRARERHIALKDTTKKIWAQARSIEPVQRNKTMAQAFAYGGMRDSSH